jgi:hypothetical protein
MLRFVLGLVRFWTALYTSGMPDALREARRAEIESDLWESQHDRRPASDLRVGVQMLLRLVCGLPDDLLWRVELMDLRLKRRRTRIWVMATGGVLLWAALWVGTALAPATLPEPPNVMIFVAAAPPPPVPPPPPPPPPPVAGAAVSHSLIPLPLPAPKAAPGVVFGDQR